MANDDKSDIAIIGKELDEQSKIKRAENREKSTQILKDNNIQFTTHNNGAHLIINNGEYNCIDFWPGTGKYKIRKTGEVGRGIFNVLRILKNVR